MNLFDVINCVHVIDYTFPVENKKLIYSVRVLCMLVLAIVEIIPKGRRCCSEIFSLPCPYGGKSISCSGTKE